MRNPTTNEYYSRTTWIRHRPASRRTSLASTARRCRTTIPQGGDINGGGCLIDATQQYTQILPEQQTLNFFGRASKMLGANTELYGEFTLVQG